ncbi:hypothetical protein BC829DRAFT_426554 [Chytridium lagenaria]|nr:hypothetical protein BC829DRAFT_426554 [Chytridium lagenaria]
MATRLDRLVLLLDTGSTPSVRSAAAQQLGDIQRQHPDELYNLLARVLVHLRSESWETRVAAGHAVAAIAKNVPEWSPPPPPPSSQDPDLMDDENDADLSFETFDISTVLKCGAPLLASAGKEFDEHDYGSMDPRERIALQKKQLKQRLGLGTEFMDLDFFSEADLKNDVKKNIPNIEEERENTDSEEDLSGLSTRELNARKRRMKMGSKKHQAKDTFRKSMSDMSSQQASQQPLKRIKEEDGDPADSTFVVEHKVKEELSVSLGVFSSGDEWPFEGLCEQLCLDLFDFSWEIRHGAAIGLREILKAHGSGPGRLIGLSPLKNERRHQRWLEDVAIRLLCVLALDRFADFVGDHVVVPVRETCAQTLGVVLQFCGRELCLQVVERGLIKLVEGNEYLKKDVAGVKKKTDGREVRWEVRHAGLIGLKYWMAVKRDLVGDVLVDKAGKQVDAPVFRAILNGLKDKDDDVRAVSSSTLLPINDILVTLFPAELVFKRIVATLWDCLVELDDLTAATASVMDLLSELISKKEIISLIRSEPAALKIQVPRLFPFLRHAITSTLLDVAESDLSNLSSCWITKEVSHLVFQNFVLEEKEDVARLSLDIWSKLIRVMFKLGSTEYASIISKSLAGFFNLLMTPIGTPFEPHFLLYPSPDGGIGSNVSVHDKAMAQQDLTVVEEEVVLRGRILGAIALGRCLALVVDLNDTTLLALVRSSLEGYLNSGFAYHRTFSHIVIEELASYNEEIRFNGNIIKERDLLDIIWSHLVDSLNAADSGSTLLFSELIPFLGRLRLDCQAFINAVHESGINNLPTLPPLPGNSASVTDPINPLGPMFVIQVAEHLARAVFPQLAAVVPARSVKVSGTSGATDIHTSLNERIRRIENGIELYNVEQLRWDVSTFASAASAVVRFGKIPPKLNPVIRSLMNSIKFEASVMLQERSAGGVANLLELNIKRAAAINDKIIKNLVVFLCADADWGTLSDTQQEEGILSLKHADVEKGVEKEPEKKGKGTKRKAAEMSQSDISAVDSATSAISDAMKAQRAHEIVRRGGIAAVKSICLKFDRMRLQSASKLLCMLLKPICLILRTPLSLLRHAASYALSKIVGVCTVNTMQSIIEWVVPLLGDSLSTTNRQGAAECISMLAKSLEDSRLLPYIVFLIVPVLRRMSDPDESVRFISTSVFAHLVKLVPLEAGVPDPEGLDPKLLKLREEERKFMGQLVGSEKVESFEVPKGINAELRPYQKEDMGLGKTLQSICMLASDHHLRAEEFKKTKAPHAAHLPSLVVCPPTLTGHWKHEIQHYAGEVLSPIVYTEDPQSAQTRSLSWNYCILDEGHIIKNAKTKLTKAVKCVKCMKRIILSGTPIQNNVLELWSLFDFLMPGFLGTEQQFQTKFGKPILASRDAKSSSREQEKGALALEALHKQVLPFLLRRMKEDVLDDLPPKIIQDYYVELSDVQKALYEDFGKSQAGTVVKEDMSSLSKGDPSGKQVQGTHVFQALQYLRKLCNHPSLVLKPTHPQYEKICKKQILLDCGIGVETSESAVATTAPHRALVFVQLKEMLDHIEHTLFKIHMPNLTYMRMDGSTDSNQRHDMVRKFNADPLYRWLGLNLTGADTVIFVEHDWNPMKDLQAMDRAHRIGQKRVVNVYRLITRGTLEEKIMG